MVILAVLRTVADNGLGRDIGAIAIAVLAGFSVLVFAASSDLFDLKIFKFDPFAFKMPKETKVEYWYVRAARRFEKFLLGGSWNYAKVRKRTRVDLKKRGRRLRVEMQKLMPEAVSRLNRDITMGVLAIAIVLVALLVLRLV
ncbi:MAG: hypothetical protein A2V52_00140 [Actinobacteria bacterium RBG_19FT_COMBO_54_7]|uniref:Uncharacterized protein n=1 Tax=Candidatus Solincola sediminis TaxID=1797199 RepID=A0A1F2WH24_9ACTN|nr:MAG: hypothetical protein A2Y75_03305 [Candidatus Solincola sediminis]OFW60434.1 MAG: hypothetical protein A2W01_09305 [Candidatus Solincola sediminis]OFW67554.1 MAG: hypothetical protein A2V52_00140 [Actinobacteria bacterium RBG_19FT_COMBO_54_7]